MARASLRLMESKSTLANPQAENVRFDVSDEAAALIRARGGQLWIWPSDDRWPHATIGPPAFHHAEWVTFRPEGLVVHVDSAIVPPKSWVLATVPGSSALLARWDGLDPKVFGRLPLALPEVESAGDMRDQTSSPLAHVRKFLVVPVLAWVFAVLWALRFFGVSSAWLWAGRTALVSAVSLAALVVWLHEKLVERREDKALERKLARSRVQQNR